MGEQKRPTEKQREAALCEAGYRCANPPCKTTLALDVHHIVLLSENGGNDLPNLLALCPTCHALHHRGEIPRAAINIWKKRLEAINAVPALSAIANAAASSHPSGFGLAASEFTFRACPVGLMRGREFFKRGLCTFVDEGRAITANKVREFLFGPGAQGEPAILTQRGPASCTIDSAGKGEHLALLRMGQIDDSALRRVSDPQILALMSEPLQTVIRYRLRPRPGEPIGLLHDPDHTRSIRGPMEFQFERGVVAFVNRHTVSESPLEHTLSPLPAPITDLGAPVFADDGRLIGITIGQLQLDSELGWRPVIGSLLPLHALGYVYDAWNP